MSEHELTYYLALQKVKGIGSVNAKKLITHLGSAEAVFKTDKQSLKKINGVGNQMIAQISQSNVINIAKKEVETIKNQEIDYLLFSDDKYPKQLKECIDAPLVLFKKGCITFNKQPIISIVGTRKMTNYGKQFIEQFITDLVPYNPIIVSGFAYGVDITAHKIAIKSGLQTIAILGHGMKQIYPKVHKKYISQVIQNGGFLTEYWYHDEPLRGNFLQRNRIIAGISNATVIIESASKGGSLVTAEIANSYNRDVFALPGRVSDSYSTGCNTLIRTNKAQLLNSAEDLVYYLNWDQQKQKKTIQTALFLDLTADEQIIYEHLKKHEKQSSDEISLKTKIPIYKISSLLLNLELKGILRPLPGKLFEIIN